MHHLSVYRGLLLAALGLLALPAAAMTFMDAQYECPIGGEKFSQRVQGSGTSFGMAFDAKPYGALMSPWPLPQCPGNGMVIYDRKLDAAALERLTPFVLGAQYQQWRKTETPYFLVAQMLQHMQAPLPQQAWVMLQATWEASPAQYPRYAARALELHEAVCPDASPAPGDWRFCQMIRGELERRLGRFDAARTRFERLQPLLLAQPADDEDAQRWQVEVTAAQLKLIEQRNTQPSQLPDRDDDT